VKDVEPAYAIVRVDGDGADDEARFTITRVVWEQAFAESEVRRLSEINADKGCRYFWQYTRVDRRTAPAS
jgi:hypothetical protein